MANSNDPKLIIDLTRMKSAQVLPPQNSLHLNETLKVLELIRKHVEKLAALPPSGQDINHLPLGHSHDAILVYGPRGSGKSTLLLTINEVIGGEDKKDEVERWRSTMESSPDSSRKNQQEWWKQVKVLPPVDPTLVEGDDIFLGTIVANILRELRKANKDLDRNFGFARALEKLGDSFRVLMPQGVQEELKKGISDPALFTERLLHNAMGGLDLARTFRDFCVEACRIFEVKTLLQPIDDADVSIDQGWAVLETVRRYMSHERILPLMFGDLDLFSVVVQDAQWKHLAGLAKIPSQGSQGARSVQPEEHVINLSDQYLLKLLRPERRIQLPDAQRRLREHGLNAVHVLWDKTNGVRLEKLLEDAGTHLFALPGKPDRVARRLLSSNTRELRGLLEALTQVFSENGRTQDREWNGFIYAMQEVFAGVLGQSPQLREPLSKLSDGSLTGWQGWLGREKDPSFFWMLDANTEGLDQRDNQRAALIQSLVSARLVVRWRQQPLEQVAYFGSVLTPMTSLADLGDDADARASVLRKWHLGWGEDAWMTTARVTVSRINPTELSSAKNVLFFPSGTRLPPKTGYRAGNLVHVIERLNKGRPAKRLGIFPWMKALNVQELKDALGSSGRELRNKLFPTVEIWESEATGDAKFILEWFRIVPRKGTFLYDMVDPRKGIAMLGDLASKYPSIQAENAKDISTLESILRAHMIGSTLHHIVVGADNDESSELELDPDAVVEDTGVEWNISPHLLKQLQDWMVTIFHQKPVLPAGQWAHVAQQYLNNLITIVGELDEIEHSIGADLERWVLAFLHNLLLVEAAHLSVESLQPDKRLDNRFSVRVHDENDKIDKFPFHINLGRVEIRRLPVFTAFATCPILVSVLSKEWQSYLKKRLDASSSEGTSSKSFVFPEIEEQSFFGKTVDIHTALCALQPRLNKPKSPSKSSSGNA